MDASSQSDHYEMPHVRSLSDRCLLGVGMYSVRALRPGTVAGLFLIILLTANYCGVIPSLGAAITAALFFVKYFQPPILKFAAAPRVACWRARNCFIWRARFRSVCSRRQETPKAGL